MILSHKYKFIFVRARKVAGTSILYNLGKWCGDDDIVNSPDRAIMRSNVLKKTNLTNISRNISFFLAGDQFVMHINPLDIKKSFPKEWESYARIGCIRNPYDIAYSMYCHIKKQKYFMLQGEKECLEGTKTFRDWIKSLYRNMDNVFSHKKNYVVSPSIGCESYWFYEDTGEEVDYDFMIRYENLEDDYKNVCKHFDISYEPLVKLNTETRLDIDEDRSYQKHYDDESREIIGKLWSRVIKRYTYEF